MEWLILILLVPAVLVPVVLLLGFAGCNQILGLDQTVRNPPKLTVTPFDVNAISLSWTSGEPNAKFNIERTKEMGGPVLLPAEVTTSSFTDDGADLTPPGLDVGTTYFYRVRVVGPSDQPPLPWSTQEHTATFIFNGKIDPVRGGSDQANLEGVCLVTRIPAPSPQGKSWPAIKITLRGSTIGDLTIDRFSISQPADIDQNLPSTSREPWDSYTDLRVVVTNEGPSAQSVSLPAGMSKSFTVDYPLDGSRDFLVAFDINPTPGQGNGRFGPLLLEPPPKTYYKRPLLPGDQIAEAAIQDRASDFEPSQSHYLVQTIEVG